MTSTVELSPAGETSPAVEYRPHVRLIEGNAALERQAGPDKALAPSSPAASGGADFWTPLLVVALGGLAVAGSYALGRAGDAGATALYWIGQALTVLPTAYGVMSPRTDTRGRVTLLVGMAATQSLLAWAYSPDQFRFPDELQHVRTTLNILHTHHLFTANTYLNVSPGFPGLEAVTSAIVDLTGLSLFHAGVLVASLSHVVLPVFVFLVYRELTGSDRSAAVATLVYATAPHTSYFNTLFIYSVPALAFLVLVLRAAIRSARGGVSIGWVAVPFAPMLITHHLTAFVGVALVALIAVVVALSGSPRVGLRIGAMSIVLGASAVLWTVDHSPATFSYLSAPAHSVLASLTGAHQRAAHSVLANVAPTWESLVAIFAAMVMSGCVVVGIALTWVSRASRFRRLIAALGLVYPAVLVLRLIAPDGSELATRALTYAMLLVACPVGLTLECLWSLGSKRAAGWIGGCPGARRTLG